MRDDLGVLSIFVTVRPEEAAAPQPPWDVRLRKGLRELVDRTRDEEPRERWAALTSRLDELEEEIERLTNPGLSGIGRALFAGLSGGEATTVNVQSPVGDRVLLEPAAHIWPLVRAADIGEPLGVVTLSRTGLRAVALRDGIAGDAVELAFEEESGDWRELKGPAGANPQLPQQGASQRDLFEGRMEEHVRRFLDRAAPGVAKLARREGWGRVIVAGDPRLTELVSAEVRHDGVAVIEDERRLENERASEVAEAVGPVVEEDRRRREIELVRRAREGRDGGGRGTLGLAEVLGTLEQGRVERLLLDADGSWQGVRAPDGRLAPPGGVPPGADESELGQEDHLGERMVEAALATDAAVTALGPEAAAELRDFEGVGAILRW